MRFIFRVFHISVWRIRAERLSGLSLCFENGAYLTAGILGIKFIKDIDKRGHVVFSLVCTIYAVVNGNEANIGIGENHLCIHIDFQIVAPQAAHVFYDNRADPSLVHQPHKPLPIGTVKVRARKTVIYEKCGVVKPVFVCVLL